LRGVHLAGMDSGNCKMELRKKLWRKLANEWKPKNIERLARECSLGELDNEIDRILNGKQVGRVLVNLTD